MAALPYVTAPGSIEKALTGIKAAETPERVTQDFVKTILKIKGGTGDQIASFLKKIGFVNSDGTPAAIYSKFRNTATGASAALAALRHGYAPLYKRNEFMHELSDEDLRGLIIEETGQGKDSSVPGLILSSINSIKKHAKGAGATEEAEGTGKGKKKPATPTGEGQSDTGAGLNLSYTINLNLPATTDVAVFNAIFKSLREHLLRNSGGQ